jgi:hypothetical protein
MRKIVAATVCIAAAFAGFAGAANASASIDLIWAATGTNVISGVAVSDSIRLNVILTAGPNGSIGAGVSVDYSEALGELEVVGYRSTRGNALYALFGAEHDTGSRVESINVVAHPAFGLGIGLSAGQSQQLGTVTFRRNSLGPAQIRVDRNGPTDGILDFNGLEIGATTTFNSAFVAAATPTATPTATPDRDAYGHADRDAHGFADAARE